MRSNKDRKLNLGTAFRLTLMNKFVKKNLDVKIHKLCNLADTEEIQCIVIRLTVSVGVLPQSGLTGWNKHYETFSVWAPNAGEL